MNKIAFFYAFSIATLPRTGEEQYQNRNVCHQSTIIRLSASKVGEFLSSFDKTKKTQNKIESSPVCLILNDNFQEVADKGEVKGHLLLEHTFRFCKNFKKITKK